MFDAYKQAFLSCYPQKTLEFQRGPRQSGGERSTWVVINGDKGSRPLLDNEIVEATRLFTQGK